MPSIRWGAEAGADLNVPFNGNVSLSGARIVNAGAADDLELAFDPHIVDANTVLYYQMDEASWSGAGSVLDSSGAGRHGNPGGGANTALGALDRYGDLSGARYVRTPTIPAMDSFTYEFWLYPLPAEISGTARIVEGPQSSIHQNKPSLFAVFSFGKVSWLPYTMGVWQHVALSMSKSGNTTQMYINGVRKINTTVGAAGLAPGYIGIGAQPVGTWYSDILVDDFRISDVMRYSGASFTPRVWRKSATQNSGVQPYGQVSYAGLSGMVPSAVSWSATVGAGYGQVKRVWVNDLSAGWVQVGGDYPASPVAVSGLVLPSADAVRVELEPEQVSGIQNETPVLDWVQLEYTAASTGRPWLPVLMQSGRYA